MSRSGEPQLGKEQPRARIVATGDFHLRTDSISLSRGDLLEAAFDTDLLLLTGDLTDNGHLPEVEALADMVSGIEIPICAVLGNHDRRTLRRREFRRVLSAAGIDLLDGDSTVFTSKEGLRIGVAGIGGYGGGFWPEEAPDLISARLSQAVAVRARREAARLEAALESLERQKPDLTIVNMHYAPTITTLGNEPIVKHWMLGNSILGRVVDGYRVALVVHGHAHLGNYLGFTPGGTPVRNVALPVVQRPVTFDIHADGTVQDLTQVDDLISPEPERIGAGSVYPPQ